MATTKVGVIGAGGVANGHLRALVKMKDVEIVAASDVSDERLAYVAREYGVKQGLKDYRDLLALPEIEAVHICTPNFMHAPIAIDALQAGKHVLCEKPPALCAADAQRMVDAARAGGRKLMFCFNYRYRNDARYVKRIIDEGDMGEIYYAKALWLRNMGIPGGQNNWFIDKQRAGGGPLIDLGVHILDLSLWLMGHPKPVSVSASTYAKFGPRGLHGWSGGSPVDGPNYTVEDLASAFIRLNSGATLTLETSWAMHTAAGRDEYGVQVYGTEGGADLDVLNYKTVDTVRVFRDVAGVPTDCAPHALQAGDGHAAAIDHFITCVREDRQPESSGEQGVMLMRIIDAIYQSAAEKREIVL